MQFFTFLKTPEGWNSESNVKSYILGEIKVLLFNIHKYILYTALWQVNLFFIEVNYSSTSLSRSYNLKIHMLKIDRRELFDNLTSHT